MYKTNSAESVTEYNRARLEHEEDDRPVAVAREVHDRAVDVPDAERDEPGADNVSGEGERKERDDPLLELGHEDVGFRNDLGEGVEDADAGY